MQNVSLVIHIGAGKTGSAAIRETMRSQSAALRSRGVFYLGAMLEAAPVRPFSWQRQMAILEFNALPEAQARSEMLTVLRESFIRGTEAGCNIYVISNEAFMERGAVVREVANTLLQEGVDVRVIAYIRRHDSWARSAYLQWGLKHKTYKGPLKDFRDWSGEEFRHWGEWDLDFYPKIKPWHDMFGGRFLLRNYDALNDSAADFLQISGIGGGDLKLHRVNESLNSEELVLRALFNETQIDEAWPACFNKLLDSKNVAFNRDIGDWLTNLLPSDGDLAHVISACQPDRLLLNQILAETDQPPLETTPLETMPVTPNTQALIGVLFRMIMQQAVKIERLETLVQRPFPAQAG